MKTVQDLVDTLNKNFDNEFDLFDKESGFEFCLRVDGAPIIDFNSRDKSFEFQSFIEYVHGKSLNIIVNFLANSNPDNWFAEKKYNIIIGIGESENEVAAYGKLDDGIYAINSSLTKNELKDDLYQFTENEIKKFQSDLPDNLAHIVELGKVEVK